MSQVRDVAAARIGAETFYGNEVVEVTSPFNGAVVGRVPVCGEEEVNAACAAAEAALGRDDFPLHARARVLEQAARELEARSESLAQLMCAEVGKPIRDARREVTRAAETLTFSAVEARKLGGQVLPAEASKFGMGRLLFTLPRPVGVVAAITPFNYPLNLVAHKLGPAIAAGCPVVLKPAPQAPLTGLALVEVLLAAGLPEDWISVLTDAGSEAGAPLVAHPTPRLITFTGSAAVGWKIAAEARQKRVALELGSTAPLIVEPDVDPGLVAGKAAAAAFAFAGQSCISVQRVIVHEQVYGAFRDALVSAAERLVCGDPGSEATDVGPVIERRHTRRLLEWIEESVASGGKVLAGAKLDGPVLRPTIIDGPAAESRIWANEAFGPVLSLRPYRDLDEAVAIANDTSLAIHAGVWTNSLSTAMRAIKLLKFPGINVNEVPTSRLDQQPYGGTGAAGNTREGPAYSVREMTEYSCISLPA